MKLISQITGKQYATLKGYKTAICKLHIQALAELLDLQKSIDSGSEFRFGEPIFRVRRSQKEWIKEIEAEKQLIFAQFENETPDPIEPKPDIFYPFRWEKRTGNEFETNYSHVNRIVKRIVKAENLTRVEIMQYDIDFRLKFNEKIFNLLKSKSYLKESNSFYYSKWKDGITETIRFTSKNLDFSFVFESVLSDFIA
jgi:hypothetical protein